MSRRDFLRLSSLGLGGLFIGGNTLLGKYVSELDPDIPTVDDALSEYKIGWQARPWVWVNLAIASKYLNGFVIHPGEEVSLLKLLRFDQMSNVPHDNTDPSRGYIAAQMSNPFELSGWGYGLCLASTAIFRACLDAPIRITERNTHYDIYKEYFQDLPIGTDAAIYYPEPNDSLPKTDLKLINPTTNDLAIHFKLYDAFGGALPVPPHEVSELWYKATYLDQLVRILRKKVNEVSGLDLPSQFLPEQTFGNQKIVVQATISGKKPEYDVFLGPVRHGDSTIVDGVEQYSFKRELRIGEKLYQESFISQYK